MVSFGDLAQSYLMKAQTSRLKGETGRITQELASGRLSDVAKSLSGDLGRLSALTRSQDLASGYVTAAQEGAFRASALQRTLGVLSESAQSLAPDLLSATLNGGSAALSLLASRGADRFDAALSALNTSVAGRNLFSGTAVGSTAVAPANTILTALRAEIVGATTPDEVFTRISAWFDAPAGFQTLAYGGGPPVTDLAVSPDDTAWLGVTANDPAVREALKGFAAAALINDPGVSLVPSDMRVFARLAGESLIGGNDALIALSARVGMSEQRIDTALSRNAAEKLTLEMATAELVQSDPFILATELEAVQTNLETLFAVTARLSRLSLTDFMR